MGLLFELVYTWFNQEVFCRNRQEEAEKCNCRVILHFWLLCCFSDGDIRDAFLSLITDISISICTIVSVFSLCLIQCGFSEEDINYDTCIIICTSVSVFNFKMWLFRRGYLQCLFSH